MDVNKSPVPQFEVVERMPLVDLLFPKRSADVKLEDVTDWPLETHYCKLVTLLAILCNRRCSPALRSKKNEENVYVEIEKDERTPDLYFIVCSSTLYLFYLGDISLFSKNRERHFFKRTNLKRHVKA
jgi:hypothetical protein